MLALVRVALLNAAAWRASFLVEVLVGTTSTIAVLVPLWIVFQHQPVIAGWSLPDAALVMAFFLMLSGVVGMLIEPNLGAIVEGVRSGSLDYLLLKPVDALLVASAQRLNPAKAWDLLAGVALLAWAVRGLPAPRATDALLAGLLFGAGLLAIYALWVLVICTSFWFVRVDNLRFLLSAVLDAGRWPVDVYRGALRWLLTLVVPVALVTSWPALALRGALGPGAVLQALLCSAALFGLARLGWRAALRSYTSASS